MPTIMGMRRRGYTPNGLKLFANRCGISKAPNIVDIGLLEASIREDLEHNVPRIMAVLDPIKVVLTNFNSDIESGIPVTQSRAAAFHPNHPEFGERILELTKEIYIERDDFMQSPTSGWQRLTLDGEVRLRHSYIVKCDTVITNEVGGITELHCSIDHDTLGKSPVGRKVKGVIHWVSCTKSVAATVRIYDRLFTEAEPDKTVGKDFADLKNLMNPDSLKIITAYIEPSANTAKNEDSYQFERIGYFVADRFDHIVGEKLVFNKTVSLKDTYKK
jgi:glutaminyl-tRNA synthetase